MVTVGSLFSGIGGIDLGLQRAGMEIKWQVEIDPYCRRVLEKQWPGVPKYGDIRAIDWSSVEPVDLIAGGFPCQPVSVAGRGRAQEDERWLWPDFARAVRMVRPEYVLVENVPGLLGRGMGIVLGDLAELGYDTEWQSIPAAAVGAPHLRWRVWIVAYPCNGGQRQLLQPLGELGSGAEANLGSNGEARAVADYNRLGNGGGHWAAEPNVGRVAYGLPKRVDRIVGLGNAVVPQIVTWIGGRIMEAESW